MIRWEKQNKIKELYKLYAKPVRINHGLTQMEYSVLMFLYRNPDCDTASAIVQTGQFSKSHVSFAVKTLEARRLISKEYWGNNNKTIHLKLTEQAGKILRELKEADDRYLSRLFEGFSEEEYFQVQCFFDRMCRNAEAELQCRKEGKKDA